MKINIERMRYKKDSLSFLLCMLGLVANVVQFIKIYSNSYMQTISGKENFTYASIGVDIVFNIIFMLIVFYMAEELKTYHRKWTFVAIIIGILQLLRIGWFPTSMMENGFYDNTLFSQIRICHIISAIMFFAAAIVGIVKSTLLMNYLEENKEAK